MASDGTPRETEVPITLGPSTPPACPLQLIQLNMKEKKVEVNEDALGRLEKRLRTLGAHKVSVVTVMGAFRTGKSFLLDLFLRFLRFEEAYPNAEGHPPLTVPRGTGEEYPLPDWLTFAGNNLEGADDSTSGFRFKGGMDACTEGIWVWSEPIMRHIKGEPVAVLLMDTQGAWDSNMTKEQSATIFGLTAVLSSKLIYNVSMQIQEDKVQNLEFFMRFAQAALRRAAQDMDKSNNQDNNKVLEEIERPFQSLDFLVRDWRNFKKDWSMEQCRGQMAEHLARHINPDKVVENTAAEALQSMFQRISCFCMPHPGFAIEDETWSGNVADISNDFVRFSDSYVREVFADGLEPKSILGSELSTLTFPLVLRNFVAAFHEAAPVTMSFSQAMTNATVLLAKEQVMKSYTKKMDQEMAKAKRGLDPEELNTVGASVRKEIEVEYDKITIFGNDARRAEAWQTIQDSIKTLHQRYVEDNSRRLEKALVSFANLALLGFCLFLLDRLSDFTCDWWLQTCADLSKVMLFAYAGIFSYIGWNVYLLARDRGKLSTGVAFGELWKEMMRLMGVYGELAQQVHVAELPALVKQVSQQGFSAANAMLNNKATEDNNNNKKDN